MNFVAKITIGTFVALSCLEISTPSVNARPKQQQSFASLTSTNWDTDRNNLASAIDFKFVDSQIVAKFSPKNSLGEKIALKDLSTILSYDHFNWVSYVEKDPYGINDYDGMPLSTPYNDPPQGGYQYDGADRFPFYWDLTQCQRCQERYHYQNDRITQEYELVFEDIPTDYRLQTGESIEFITHLVGVKNYDSQTEKAAWETITTFRWKLTNVDGDRGIVSLIAKDIQLTALPKSLLDLMEADGAILPEIDRSNLAPNTSQLPPVAGDRQP
jgi:hypothetical protein